MASEQQNASDSAGTEGGATATDNAAPAKGKPSKRKRILWFVAIVVVVALANVAVTALLVSIFNRKAEAKNPYLRIVDVTEQTTDPAVWGKNWPGHYDMYLRTADASRTRYGGSDAMPAQKLDRDPWLKRMFAGYAFSIDYRDRRGHAYMLADQLATERVTKRPQPGACLHCHASVTPTYARLGVERAGADPKDYWGAVMKGFPVLCAMPYAEAHAELLKTPDGAAGSTAASGKPHPVSCVDCHDPDNLDLRVTRPGFVLGIAALARSDEPVPHLQSVERWRQGDRSKPYDPNRDGTRQEMRSFVCAQCHVEYYCGPKETLLFPWGKGLKVERIEAFYDEHKFPSGEAFSDWTHAETKAPVYKAQHPEFELWSQGTHARAGVACADCHMPYTRQGAMKISDHHVRSPLLNVARACQVCHPIPEQELLARVQTIQDRTHDLLQRGGTSLVDMIDAIKLARANGATEEQLKPALDLHRKAQWRLDFVAAENSMGFHAPQESARVLAEAIDYARQGEIAAQRLMRQPNVAPSTQPAAPPEGVTPTEKSPAAGNPAYPDGRKEGASP